MIYPFEKLRNHIFTLHLANSTICCFNKFTSILHRYAGKAFKLGISCTFASAFMNIQITTDHRKRKMISQELNHPFHSMLLHIPSNLFGGECSGSKN